MTVENVQYYRMIVRLPTASDEVTEEEAMTEAAL
jgi:hypothetical protein